MKVIVHHPADQAAQAELAKQVARLHADTALQHIQKLSCSKSEKAALVDCALMKLRATAFHT